MESRPGHQAANDILVHVVSDDGAPVTDLLLQTVEAAARAALRHASVDRAELTVALVTAEEIRELNRTYRGIDEETDVLSFAMTEGQAFPTPPEVPLYLGDLAISVPRACQQARDYGHSDAREFAFLAVHGVLHLLGFDHHEAAAQRRMRSAEEAVLAALGLPRDQDTLAAPSKEC